MNTKRPFIILLLFLVISALKAQDTIKVRKGAGEVYTVTDEVAQFPGGHSAMSKFIATNVQFPRVSRDSLSKPCKVFLKFIVNEDGGISDVQVLKGCADSPEYDAEAIRVVGLMPKWTAAKVGGVSVKSYFNLPLSFKLQ